MHACHGAGWNFLPVVDHGFIDIVAQGFDAGVRLGEQVAKDMIAMPIGPEMRMAVVGSPDYFRKRPIPLTPQDLTTHTCINLRMATQGGLFPWEFERDGHELRVRVEGQVIVNHAGMRMACTLDGLGLAYLPEDQILDLVADGRLIRVLDDWCDPFPGYHLYYPSRRHASPAFAVVLEALRYRRWAD